jgi:serine/threonine-protein kinase HipA
MDRLFVHYQRRLVGTLELSAAGEWAFAYVPEWRQSAEGFPVSLSLPLGGALSGASAHGFFANLLPEAEVRRLLCRRLGISESNDFALLAAIGGECAGALSVSADPDSGEPGSRGEYRELSASELSRLAAREGVLAGITAEKSVRLSLAGAQDKLPVRLEGDRILLPHGGAASTHILKFESRHFKHLPANEVLMSLVAIESGLPTAPARLLRFGRRSACCVERYDRRVLDDGTVQRIHQEDFCQALGLPPGAKYEKEGGPTFARCFEVAVAHVREPLADGRILLQWLAFNALTFNSDAHAKNASLLYDQTVPRLAPFYDLLCTRAYPHLDRNLAMKIGGEEDPTILLRRHWEQLAEATGLKPSFVLDTVRELAERLPGAVVRARSHFKEAYRESPALELVIPKVTRQVRRLLKQLDS